MQVAGAEVLVAETMRRLGAKLHPVVLCLDGVGQLGERMRAEGVEVVALGRQPGLDLRVARRLAREIRLRHLEVVHAHQYTPFFYTALARLMGAGRIHVMFTEHGRHYPDVVSSRRRTVNRLLLARLADEVNGVCDFSARSLVEVDGFSQAAIEVIPNGIDPRRYEPASDRAASRLRMGLDPGRRYVICVARFHPVKNHAMLVNAFAEVADKARDVDLLLAGDGPMRQDLESQVANLGLTRRVRFLGIRDDVPELLGVSDLFVLTSLSEAASFTLLEAMATSLPVVVTDVGGNPEIVRQGIDGVLVPRTDANQAAMAMLRILQDPRLAASMGESARRRVRERYSLENTVAMYFDRYVAAAARLRARGR